MHFTDYTLIFLLALILFGPKKLPEIGRQIGKLMVEFRRASNEFKSQIDEELRNMEMQDRQKKLEAETAAVQTPALSAPEAPSLTTPNAPPEFDGLPEPDDSSEPSDYPETYDSRESDIEADHNAPSDETDEEDKIHPVILPPSTGETVSASSPYTPAASQELLEDDDPFSVYDEASTSSASPEFESLPDPGSSPDEVHPAILPSSTGEPVSASSSYMPVASQELLDAAAIAPHPVYAEALAAEQNGNSHSTGPAPENSQAAVNHG